MRRTTKQIAQPFCALAGQIVADPSLRSKWATPTANASTSPGSATKAFTPGTMYSARRRNSSRPPARPTPLPPAAACRSPHTMTQTKAVRFPVNLRQLILRRIHYDLQRERSIAPLRRPWHTHRTLKRSPASHTFRSAANATSKPLNGKVGYPTNKIVFVSRAGFCAAG